MVLTQKKVKKQSRPLKLLIKLKECPLTKRMIKVELVKEDLTEISHMMKKLKKEQLEHLVLIELEHLLKNNNDKKGDGKKDASRTANGFKPKVKP